MAHRSFPITAEDGKKLHVNHWYANRSPSGVVQIVHGLGEHSLRYADFARRLVAEGYEVYSHDHRGHGKTAGGKAHLGHLGRTKTVGVSS